MLCERWRRALRSRLVGGGSKQPGAASVKSCGGERPRLKGVTLDHVMWGLDRRAQANLWVKHRNRTMTTPKPGFTLGPGSSMAGTYLLAMRCPVQKRRESSLGFRAELENLVGDGKGKGTSGSPVRPKVPRRQPGADCSVIAWNRGNSRGAKGAGHPRRDLPESTGNRRNSLISTAGGSLQGVARAG